jgi:hypothetical protein
MAALSWNCSTWNITVSRSVTNNSDATRPIAQRISHSATALEHFRDNILTKQASHTTYYYSYTSALTTKVTITRSAGIITVFHYCEPKTPQSDLHPERTHRKTAYISHIKDVC